MIQLKRHKREMRHKRVRGKVYGTKERPRFVIFRSNKRLFGQLIDDDRGITLLGVSEEYKKDKKNKAKKGEAGKMHSAREFGRIFGKKALAKKIKKAVFDRGGYKYHGRIKAAAEGAREAGLEF